MKAEFRQPQRQAGPAKRNNITAATPSMTVRSSRLALNQPTFNWKAQGKYGELLNFEIEVKSYDICNSERVTIIMNWLGCEGLHLMQTLTDDWQ